MPIISESWDKVIKDQFESNHIKNIQQQLATDLRKGYQLCPKAADIFNAFKLTPFESIKVLVLGQDPYFTPGVADGLAFSASRMTPSLDVIFKEIKGSTGRVRTKTNLADWATQGVFLLNTCLTTLAGKALSHQDKGWEPFTRAVIQRISRRNSPLVVMLWGKHSISYAPFIDGSRHLILKAPHPQSDNYINDMTGPEKWTRNTFAGCQHFSMCNDYMQSKNISQINWGNPKEE